MKKLPDEQEITQSNMKSEVPSVVGFELFKDGTFYKFYFKENDY